MTLPAQDIVERLRSPLAISGEHRDQAADTISRLTADNEALRKEVERVRDGNRYAILEQYATARAEASESRADALAQEAERLRGALVQIAHTYTEDSHGGTKSLPAYEYQDIARAALGDRP